MNTTVTRPGHMLPNWERDAYEALEPREQCTVRPYGVEAWASMEAATRDQEWADAAAEVATCAWADRLMSFSVGACVAFALIWVATLILNL